MPCHELREEKSRSHRWRRRYSWEERGREERKRRRRKREVGEEREAEYVPGRNKEQKNHSK